jgi:WD40 repeat protein
MPVCRALLGLIVSGCVAPALFAQPPAKPVKKDATPAGLEALPEGAVVRLGSDRLQAAAPIGGAAMSADGKYLASATNASVLLYERKTGKPLAEIPANDMPLVPPVPIAFSPDGKTLAFVAMRNLVLTEVPTGKVLHTLEVPEPNFNRGQGLSFSADGKVVAVGSATPGGNKKAKAFAWEVSGGKVLAALDVAQNATCSTALSPDGKLLLTWGRHVPRMIGEDAEAGQFLQLWELATGKELRKFKVDRPNAQLGAAALSPDGKTVAVASGLSTFHLFETDTAKETRCFAGRRGVVTLLQFSPDGKTLVAGNYEGAVQAWHVGSGKRLEMQPGPRARLLSFAFPAGDEVLALGLLGQTIAWWDAVTGHAGNVGQGHQSQVLAVAFAADGRTLTSASFDGKVLCWDPAGGKLLRQFALIDDETVKAVGPGGLRLSSLALSPDGRFAATGSIYATNSVRLWDLFTGQVACDFETAKTSGAFGLAFSPRGERLAAAAMSKYVNVWDADSGQEQAKLTYEPPAAGPGGGPPRLAFSPDGQALAVIVPAFDAVNGVTSAKLVLLEAATGKARFEVEVPAANLPGAAFAGGPMPGAVVAFSPDGKYLALPGPSRTVVLARADSGKEWKRLDMPGGFAAVTALAFSPDGRTLAVAHGGERLIDPATGGAGAGPPLLGLWELASGHLRVEYKGHQGGITCLAFAPDGLTLASGGVDTTVLVWDVGARHGLGPLTLTAAELQAEWVALAKPDAKPAFQAQRRLIASPAEAVAFIKKELPPAKATAVEAKKLAQLVADLDSEAFETRDEAYRTLEKLGTLAEPALRKAREGKVSLEMRRRIDDLLDKVDRGTLTAEELQGTRGVEVLERIATPEARAVLATLAEGAPPAYLTQQAKKALARLGK